MSLANKLIKALAMPLMALPVVCAAFALPPQHVELTFEIRFGKMTLGKGEDSLKHDGKRYEVISDTIPQGLASIFINDIRRESRGSIDNGGLQPVSFIERGRKNGERIAEFDWTNNTLRLIHDDNNEVVPLPPGTIDQASLPYAFAFNGSVPDDFNVHVTDGRRLTSYQYRIVGRERIEAALGELETIHVEKVRGPDDKRSFEFWLAVEHHYLPVKLLFTDHKGRAFESLVTSIRYPQ